MTREQLMQILASWSERSISARTALAQILVTPLGIHMSANLLQPLDATPNISVRELFPFAVLLKNAASSPAGAEMQPLADMIAAASAKPVGRLVAEELSEASRLIQHAQGNEDDSSAEEGGELKRSAPVWNPNKKKIEPSISMYEVPTTTGSSSPLLSSSFCD